VEVLGAEFVGVFFVAGFAVVLGYDEVFVAYTLYFGCVVCVDLFHLVRLASLFWFVLCVCLIGNGCGNKSCFCFLSFSFPVLFGFLIVC